MYIYMNISASPRTRLLTSCSWWNTLFHGPNHNLFLFYASTGMVGVSSCVTARSRILRLWTPLRTRLKWNHYIYVLRLAIDMIGENDSSKWHDEQLIMHTCWDKLSSWDPHANSTSLEYWQFQEVRPHCRLSLHARILYYVTKLVHDYELHTWCCCFLLRLALKSLALLWETVNS